MRAALAEGRAAHQELMVDSCTITRPGTPLLDRSTSQLTPAGAATLYSGPCRVKPQRVPRNEQAGERLVVVGRYELAVPFTALPTAALHVADIVTITASQDPRLMGSQFAVMAVDFSSTATAWRLTIEAST